MTTAAVMMARDEADIIATTVRNLAEQVDFVIVADNRSTDGTRDILEALAQDYDLTVVDDPEVGYYQSRKMTALAHQAGERGADWVIPADADEVWCSQFGPVGKVLETQVPDHIACVAATIYDHHATAFDAAAQADPVRRMLYRRPDPLPLHKVACRYRPDLTIAQGNHRACYDFEPHALPGLLVIRHFPYRSMAQMVHKARNGAEAYAATGDDLPPDAGDHWRGWGNFTDEQLSEVFVKWYWRSNPGEPYEVDGERLPPLVYDPAPLGWG